MAQKVLVIKSDDLDGKEGDGIATVRFSVDGAAYEIDLSPANQRAFHKAVGKYVEAARRDRGGVSVRPVRTNPGRLAAIREWARENGHEVSDKGRIPTAIVEAYNAR